MAAAALAWACGARAALPDEIQVYTDDIDKPGEFGLELHVNTTPSGRSVADYPREIVPAHAWRFTPEFSYGVTHTLEAGLYLPMVFSSEDSRVAGAKLRLKWLPLQVDEKGEGTFAGVNFEYAWISERAEQATRGIEVRPIIGWRDATWLIAINPILEFDRSGPSKSGTPSFSPAIKVAREVREGVAAGLEYYADLGRLSHLVPRAEQAHALFVTIDVDRGPLPFNFGVGRGVNGPADKWTVKAIFEIPLGGKR